MTKKGDDKPRREFTRQERSRWQREARKNRIVFIVGLVLVVAVILTVSVGWFITDYRPMHATMLTVNEKSFDMGYYINMLKIYGKGQSADYLYYLAGQVPTIIQRNELIAKGAASLNISVSDDEVKAELKKQNLSGDYWDVIKTDLLVRKLLSDHFDNEVAKTAEQRDILAMFLESKSQADEIAAALEKGEDFASLAKQFSLDSYTKEKEGALGWHPKDIVPEYLGTTTVEQYAFATPQGTISPPLRDDEKTKSVGYWLINVLETRTEQGARQVHAQAILVGSAEEARNVKDRLDKGEDFATVAKEVSQLAQAKDNGGDLGWIAAGTMGTAFDGYAFADTTPTAKLSEAVQDTGITTRGGYWLIKVAGAQTDRTISDDDRQVLKYQAFDTWVAEMLADPANTIDTSPLTEERLAFAVQKAAGT